MTVNTTVNIKMTEHGRSRHCLPEPPAEFAVTEQLYDATDKFDSTGSEEDEALPQAIYESVRKDHVRNDRIKSVNKLVRTKMMAIRDVMENGNRHQVLELMQARHAWRRSALSSHAVDVQICSHPYCSTVATIGSDFCIAHIIGDGDQRMFTSCEVCGRPYPVLGECFGCRE